MYQQVKQNKERIVECFDNVCGVCVRPMRHVCVPYIVSLSFCRMSDAITFNAYTKQSYIRKQTIKLHTHLEGINDWHQH